MQQLTPGAQIDELRATLQISEQRRQRAEARLADRERQLGTATVIIAAQDQQIDDLRAELATSREAALRQVPVASRFCSPRTSWA